MLCAGKEGGWTNKGSEQPGKDVKLAFTWDFSENSTGFMNRQRGFPKYWKLGKCHCDDIVPEVVAFPASLSQGSIQLVAVPRARMEEPVSTTDRVLFVLVATLLEESTAVRSWWMTILWVLVSKEFSGAICWQCSPLPQGLTREPLLVQGLTSHFNEWQL